MPRSCGEALGVAARLAAHEERDLAEFLLGVAGPADGSDASGSTARAGTSAGLAAPSRRRCGRAAGCAAEMRRRGAVVELEVVAEHRQQMLLQAHHQRMDPGVEDDVGALEAHLRRVARREILHMDGAEITAQGMPRRLAMWRSICVPSTSSGCSSATLASTSR